MIAHPDPNAGNRGTRIKYSSFFQCLDIQKYKDDLEYRKKTNARLDFINGKIKDASKYAIIGSHVDKVKIEEGKSIITIIQGFVKDKPYARLLNTNFFAYNLTSKEDMNELVNKLF